ncbi:S8 family peptidase [bacterium]|nr:S8 family peptidase [bacterium]
MLEFASDPQTQLLVKGLENRTRGIELLAVRERDGAERAVVYVPDDAISHFNEVLNRYLTEETKKGHPQNEPLVNSIREIRLAVLESFWTDDPAELPRDERPVWWEVWLRRETVDEPPPEFVRFDREAGALGVRIRGRWIPFPDRIVTLARGSLSQLASCAELLGSVSELRRAKEAPSEFIELTPREEADWVRDLATRLQAPPKNAPSVCLLDTGVDREHPLLAPGTRLDDVHSLVPAWGTADHDGHGTKMAGLCLHGDLTAPLVATGPIAIGHWLESVKLLPPRGQNDPELYGALTAEAIARAETTAAERDRAVCMAVTTDGRDRGRPSSWSGAVDDIAAGTHDGARRLIVVSAGNAAPGEILRYPESNETDPVQDPGQAWNALTIGAYTGKAVIQDAGYEGWTPLARPGALSPWSTTSATFVKTWPIKPDLVLEGGNFAVNPPRNQEAEVDSLQLLTTRRRVEEGGARRLLVPTNGTSAAAALAARMAATPWGSYPRLWPETVRALLVHSADWTPEMRTRYLTNDLRGPRQALVRCCGFGVPDVGRALWSARNALILVVQESLTPFGRDEKNRANMRDMHVHALPWPHDELLALGDAPVELRVTLSYFVEASPGQRGWRYRHRYASHGLRFDVRTPEESLTQFRHRLNRKAREEEDGRKETSADTERWFLGPDLRSLGSIHSDRWAGRAVELARRGFVGIYPVIGWWRERPDLGKLDTSARYALVISITTPVTAVDLYTPVATMIAAPLAVENEDTS